MKLDAIRVDGGTQTRAEMDAKTVSEYAGEMEDGTQFPPVILYFDGVDHWLADGFHRYWAAHQLDRDILAETRPGGRLDALTYALAANSKNGLRRTNADKRRCVEIALREFPDYGGRAIAEMCGVSHTFVEGRRPQLATNASSSGDTTTHAPVQTTARKGRDGKVRKSPQAKKKSAASAQPEKSVDLESDTTGTPPGSNLEPTTAEAKPMISGESHKLGNGEYVDLPLEGFLTGVQLKTGLATLKNVSKQLGDGIMDADRLTRLERYFLKTITAVFAALGNDLDPEERAEIAEVLRIVAHTVYSSQ